MNSKLFRMIAGGCFGLLALANLIQHFQYRSDAWGWFMWMGFLAVMIGIFIGKYLVSAIGAGVVSLVELIYLFQSIRLLKYYYPFGNVLFVFLYFLAAGLLTVTALSGFLPSLRKLSLYGGIASAGTYFLACIIQLIVRHRTTFLGVVVDLTFMGGALLLGFAISMAEGSQAAAPAGAKAAKPADAPSPQPYQAYQQPYQAYQQPYQAYQQPYQAYQQPYQAYQQPAEPQPFTPPAEPQVYTPQWQAQPAEPEVFTPPAEPEPYKPLWVDPPAESQPQWLDPPVEQPQWLDPPVEQPQPYTPQWQAPPAEPEPYKPQWLDPPVEQPQWLDPPVEQPQPYTPPAEPQVFTQPAEPQVYTPQWLDPPVEQPQWLDPPVEQPQPYTPPAEPQVFTQPAEPPQVNTPPADPVAQNFSQLQMLKSLLDQGILTPEEFEAKKRQILGL